MQRTPRQWLLDFMRAGIDCVAVTDHNTGHWVDPLREALTALQQERPDGYRPLVLFPGVEITVNGGVHLLAILPPDRTTSDIDRLLGAAGFHGTMGSSDASTTRSWLDVVSAIVQAGGLAIPAHVDGSSGLLCVQTGPTLQQSLACPHIFAMEVIDPNAPKPRLYTQSPVNWTEVLGSDSHHPAGAEGQRYPGSHFTWIKMGTPSLEGLRLALLDGRLSVRRSDCQTSDPNEHAALVLESIEVRDARYMGRNGSLQIELNPWLNAIIGGRGTGKSTLVEFLRIVLRRQGEVPGTLVDDLAKYGRVNTAREDDSLLTGNARLSVVYRKDGARFTVQWSPDGDLDPILEQTGQDAWSPSVGEVAQRFPIRIFSQKQIYQLAKQPEALLRLIDQAPEVGRRAWDERWKAATTEYLSLRAKARELDAGLSEGPRLQGELEDITRKLRVFEQSGHAEVLKAYQHSRRQQRVVEEWQEQWQRAGDRIREVASALVPDPLDGTRFDREAARDEELLKHAEHTRVRIEQLRERLEALAAEADQVLVDWTSGLAGLPWQSDVDAAAGAYRALQERLATEDAGDPSAYGTLVQHRQLVEARLKQLAERHEEARRVREQSDERLGRLTALRRELTTARETFLHGVLASNGYVRIAVRPYRSTETVESEFRLILGREIGGFEKDIGVPRGEGLLGGLYPAAYGTAADPATAEMEARLAQLKREVRATASQQSGGLDVRDQRFAAHLSRLPPEALDRLDLWFPEDSLDVQYSPSGDGRKFRSIQDGSPGQKTAALLAFLLSHGTEPLVLDQPEDDLDNRLIYDLIVAQLREVKSSRQLIVVTHNPNIVVNGDAELVVALRPGGGQTQVQQQGSLQEKEVRQVICDVMEGGREAFELRYRRIALKAGDV
jgi:ABC-type cobalamin/Fe3+-siderophores transport system ATPase subunit